MALITATQATAPEGIRKDQEERYTTTYLKWKGLVDDVPVLASALEAKAEAVTASWRTYGDRAKEAAKMFDNFSGNGKQSFKTIIHNLYLVYKVGGDSYAEIVYNKDLGIENLRVLHPDDVDVIVRNGDIKRYEVGQDKKKFKTAEIFHLMNNPIGAMCHGRSEVEILNDLCIDWKQLMDDTSELAHRNVKPVDFFEMDTDDQGKIQDLLDEYAKAKNKRGADVGIPKDLMSLVQRPAHNADPGVFNRIIIDQIMMRTRVPELALGTGSVNSEESAKMQYMGFRQAVRWDQKVLEEAIRSQLLFMVFPESTPKIKWSFAAEPQEESHRRLLTQFQTIGGSPLNDELKGLILLNTLYEMGVIEDVGKERTGRRLENRRGRSAKAAGREAGKGSEGQGS